MGLDQYAYSRLPEQSPDDIEPRFIWRKHAKLQEFMERLFEARTGQSAADLNCAELELQAEDIATLQAMVERQDMPESPGGFSTAISSRTNRQRLSARRISRSATGRAPC